MEKLRRETALEIAAANSNGHALAANNRAMECGPRLAMSALLNMNNDAGQNEPISEGASLD